MLRPLPLGIQTFSDIVKNDFLYVDKTAHIYELIRYPKGAYFLSRPRRFGKSLLLSTLKDVFRGEQDLFKSLWLADSDYAWEQYPVIHLDFSLAQVKNLTDLSKSISTYLRWVAEEYQVSLAEGDYQTQFAELIVSLAKDKPVVILIDEYDKPILDNIDDVATAQAIRETLKSFYTLIKGLDRHIRFVFITGISKFSRVGIFSGLNNLVDLSLNPKFSTMLGLTEAELSHYFSDYLAELGQQQQISSADVMQEIRHWYNGFRFSATGQDIYNPFSTLLLFYHQRFSNYWFESGTPTFLIKLIQQQAYDIQQLENLKLDELDFSTYDIENLAIVPLLFQTGYLSIKDYNPERRLYTLYYPNFEVKSAFLSYLLSAFNYIERGLNTRQLWRLIDTLQSKDLNLFFTIFNTFLAQIPYDIQLKQEKYYQSIFYLIFTLLGLRV